MIFKCLDVQPQSFLFQTLNAPVVDKASNDVNDILKKMAQLLCFP